MAWPAVVMAVSAAVGAIANIAGGASSSKDATAAALNEARAESGVTGAKIEQLRRDERILKGQTLAAVAGSGVKVGIGSPMQIAAEQAREFARERAIVAKVGATKAQAGLQRGSMVASQARYQGYGQGLSQAATAFSLFASLKTGPVSTKSQTQG